MISVHLPTALATSLDGERDDRALIARGGITSAWTAPMPSLDPIDPDWSAPSSSRGCRYQKQAFANFSKLSTICPSSMASAPQPVTTARMDKADMTDTSTTAHDQGRAGRPPSPATRRSRLRMSYINAIGVENLTPAITEGILAAVELTCLAAEQRTKVTKSGAVTADDLLAVVRLENAASRARLNLAAINTNADAAA